MWETDNGDCQEEWNWVGVEGNLTFQYTLLFLLHFVCMWYPPKDFKRNINTYEYVCEYKQINHIPSMKNIGSNLRDIQNLRGRSSSKRNSLR